ncbi:MAG: tetratricopeptide repeat protein, partial [Wenzhouxiangella sp.]|nr:tetratricopeptide repeat protein [Wenzhouxiangella sp.]
EVSADNLSEPVREAIERARAAVAATADSGPNERALIFGNFGDVLLAHGFAAEARVAYSNARELAPAVFDWHYMLGVLELGEGQLDAAIGHLDRALEIHGGDYPARIRRGDLLLDLGLPNLAEKDFERALLLNPDSVAARAGLGRVALDRSQFEQAADYLSEALELAPAATRLHEPLGRAYRGLGDIERARFHFDQRGDGDVPIRDPLLDRVTASSRSPQMFLELALDQAEQGNLAASRGFLIQALALDPDDALVLENYGEVTARMGDLDEARAAFRRLLDLTPDSADAHFYLGQVEELRGEPAAALEAYEAALALDPGNEAAREAIPFALMAQQRFEGAAERFRALAAATSDDERRRRHLYWQGLAQAGAGNCRDSAALLEQARDLAAAFDPDIMGALARLRATCLRGDDDDLREALVWAEMVYDTSPGMNSATTLAMVSAALGQFDDAVDFQAQAMYEALRSGTLESRDDLKTNMERYQSERRAETPFAANDPLFSIRLAGR